MNTKQNIAILAIESSCDDTAAAIIVNGNILANVVASQEIHKIYGGVVPELASRSHQENIVPVVQAALKEANITLQDLSAIAVTQGPGLLGSLLVGVSFAKATAFSLGIPLIGVNHLNAHIAAHYIDEPKPSFPFMCLLVSGGHTRILKVNSYTNLEILGETLDDAAGEAFDKAAKMLGLEYPGGPLIQKNAMNGDPKKYSFTTGKVEGFNYSFSGLKTGILNFLKKGVAADPDFIEKNLADICASVQFTIVEYLIEKCVLAAKEKGLKQWSIAGGVSANSYLRERMEEEGEKRNCTVFVPKFEYCTDNAGMIAMEAFNLYKEGIFSTMEMKPYARVEK